MIDRPHVSIKRVSTIADAVSASAAAGTAIMAGGCEFGLALRAGRRPLPDTLVDIGGVTELTRLDAHPKIGLSIGAGVRLREVANHLWIAKRWAALHEAVEQLLPPQVRATGTVVGNLCAGRSHYDMATALMALRADLRVRRGSVDITRALSGFYRASGEADLAPGDLVLAVNAPPPSPDGGSAFRRIERPVRRPGEIGKVSAAAYLALDPDGRTILDATLAIGGCIPAPVRLPDIEAALIGRAAAHDTFAEAGARAAETLPLPDGAEPFWRRVVSVLARDALEQAASRARSKHDPFDDAAAFT